MTPNTEIADLKLIVRALHRDVSTLDDRLRRLESEIRELRARAVGRPDLVVFRSLDARGA